MRDSVIMKKFYEKFVDKIKQKYPKKSFGYFLAMKGVIIQWISIYLTKI
ncbi:hypothetical protein C823_007474 [Eubacterium plexicaudatum ASF492]|nr:hypothetical protein C823_007474 [Eubacterium plexicaudatum ASF492]